MIAQADVMAIPYASGTFQAVMFSPPYWGLRFYAGTAKWEGGDANCEHTITHYNDNLKPNVDRLYRGDKSKCLKCGAHRKDNQLGTENLHDCLGWATGNVWELRDDLTDDEVIYVYRELIKAGVLEP